MTITIRPLTPELSEDYFDFFENRAFTDASPYRCYCQVFQMSKAEYEAAYSLACANPGSVSREMARQQIAAGRLRGYLAYDESVSIGWCNVNDKASFPAEPYCSGRASLFHAPAEKREKAVICFEIAPEYRWKGVATALLRRALADAKAEGYTAVEGFPEVHSQRYEWDSPGPLRLYQKEGFRQTAAYTDFLVMRRELN